MLTATLFKMAKHYKFIDILQKNWFIIFKCQGQKNGGKIEQLFQIERH